MTDQIGAGVVFYRPPRFWRDRVRTYKLILDGQVCAELNRGDQATVQVAPGGHVAQARISWTGSPKVEFDVQPGQVVRLIVEPGREGSVLDQAMSEERYLSLFVESSPIIPHDPPRRMHRTVWTGALATGAAVVLVAQLVLVTSSIRLVDKLLQGRLTFIDDRGLRLLPWLSMIELVAAAAGIAMVATTRAPARQSLMGGGFLVISALAVWALAVRPAPDLLVRIQDYHQLRDLYAVGLTVALVTAGFAWRTMGRPQTDRPAACTDN